MASITLYLDSEAITAYQDQRGVLVELARFHQTPTDQQSFEIFLHAQRQTFLSLLSICHKNKASWTASPMSEAGTRAP